MVLGRPWSGRAPGALPVRQARSRPGRDRRHLEEGRRHPAMQRRDHRIADQFGANGSTPSVHRPGDVDADAEEAAGRGCRTSRFSVALADLPSGAAFPAAGLRSTVKAPVPMATGRLSSSSVAVTRTKATRAGDMVALGPGPDRLARRRRAHVVDPQVQRRGRPRALRGGTSPPAPEAVSISARPRRRAITPVAGSPISRGRPRASTSPPVPSPISSSAGPARRHGAGPR
jgi:hypothetical protein